MQAVRFGGIYGLGAKNMNNTAIKMFNTQQIVTALTTAATAQNITLLTDPYRDQIDPYCNSVLIDVLRDGKIPMRPATPYHAFINQDHVLVFTQNDAKDFEAFKTGIQAFWKQDTFANRVANKTWDAMISRAFKIAKVSRMASTLWIVAGQLPMFGIELMGKVTNPIQAKLHKRKATQFLAKWKPFLDKLPKPEARLSGDAVLAAIHANKFNTETGAIAQEDQVAKKPA